MFCDWKRAFIKLKRSDLTNVGGSNGAGRLVSTWKTRTVSISRRVSRGGKRMKTRAPESIDEYIDSLPANVQKILQKIRKTIQKAAPAAEEAISYQMPSFRLNGYLIYFAAHANHIGL